MTAPKTPKGFEFRKQTVKVTLSDYEVDGVAPEFRLTKLTNSKMLRLIQVAEVADRLMNGADQPTAEDLAALAPMFELITDSIVEWNMTDNGEPVPVTAETVGEMDMMMTMQLLGGWMQSLGGVPAPLAAGSANGKPPQELFAATGP